MSSDRALQAGTRRRVRPGRGFRPHQRRIGLPRALDHEAFLGVLSHELRTPITTIYGGAQILATRELSDSSRRELAADVGEEAERLYRVVEDVVALLRTERGELQPAREPVAVGRLVAAAIVHELGRDPELRIRYQGAADAATDEADDGLLGHVIRNLLDNAIRHSTGGSPVDVIVGIEGNEVVVRVLDRGPEPADHARRDAPATRAGMAGGGLGLFVAARLIQAMHGRSWARSRASEGGGAEFGFALPSVVRPG